MAIIDGVVVSWASNKTMHLDGESKMSSTTPETMAILVALLDKEFRLKRREYIELRGDNMGSLSRWINAERIVSEGRKSTEIGDLGAIKTLADINSRHDFMRNGEAPKSLHVPSAHNAGPCDDGAYGLAAFGNTIVDRLAMEEREDSKGLEEAWAACRDTDGSESGESGPEERAFALRRDVALVITSRRVDNNSQAKVEAHLEARLLSSLRHDPRVGGTIDKLRKGELSREATKMVKRLLTSGARDGVRRWLLGDHLGGRNPKVGGWGSGNWCVACQRPKKSSVRHLLFHAKPDISRMLTRELMGLGRQGWFTALSFDSIPKERFERWERWLDGNFQKDARDRKKAPLELREEGPPVKIWARRFVIIAERVETRWGQGPGLKTRVERYFRDALRCTGHPGRCLPPPLVAWLAELYGIRQEALRCFLTTNASSHIEPICFINERSPLTEEERAGYPYRSEFGIDKRTPYEQNTLVTVAAEDMKGIDNRCGMSRLWDKCRLSTRDGVTVVVVIELEGGRAAESLGNRAGGRTVLTIPARTLHLAKAGPMASRLNSGAELEIEGKAVSWKPNGGWAGRREVYGTDEGSGHGFAPSESEGEPGDREMLSTTRGGVVVIVFAPPNEEIREPSDDKLDELTWTLLAVMRRGGQMQREEEESPTLQRGKGGGGMAKLGGKGEETTMKSASR